MSYDNYLTKMADTLSVTAASVEYRLAPEHPYPMAQQDAVDAALFALSAEGESQLGAPLKILGGESAGGYLAVWTALSLRKDHNIDVRSKLDAVIATAGIFDMTLTPSVLSHERNIIIGKYGTEKFVDAAFGNVPMEGRKLGTVSPLYADTSDMPPALFLVGQVDPLVDDSVFMASRWSLAGNKTQLRVVPAACHAWTLFPLGEVTDEGLEEVFSFVKQLKQ